MKNIFNIQDDKRIQVYSRTTKKYYSTKLEVMTSGENMNDLEVVHDAGFWDTVNWTKEPTETFEELLGRRCRQLRDKYNYLILYYSGGSDSDTVLQSFINSGVHLDEVVVNRICFNNNDAPLKDIELAIQKMRSYSKRIPLTKMTVNNITDRILSDFSNKQQWIDTPYNGTIGMMRRFTVEDFSEYDEGLMIRKGTTAHIFGDLKPVMAYKDKKWYTLLTHWGTATNLVGEWFFTSKDMPELHVKQCHMVKNYFTRHKINVASIGGLSEGITLVVKGRTLREHLEASCRLRFDQSWQPNKMQGLGHDILTGNANEDSLVYQHLRKYVPDLFQKYMYGVVIPIVAEGKRRHLINNEKLDMNKIKGRQYCLSSVE